MKRVRQIGRSLITASLAACAIAVLQPQSAWSRSSDAIVTKQPDLICYIQSSNGSVINLSRFCAEDDAVAISSTDRRFLELYQRSLEGRGSRSVPAQNPQALVERAQAVCTAARSGPSQPPTLRRGREFISNPSFRILLSRT
ncbi:MAG: hypothetical protein LH660_07320 [Phormidesmis sp. CAN_BIN36]|nr:hypothetical protein [Phormidesmis sp. CAN_BIN36]